MAKVPPQWVRPIIAGGLTAGAAFLFAAIADHYQAAYENANQSNPLVTDPYSIYHAPIVGSFAQAATNATDPNAQGALLYRILEYAAVAIGGSITVYLVYKAVTTPEQRAAQQILLVRGAESLGTVAASTATGGPKAGLAATKDVPAAGIQDVIIPERAVEKVKEDEAKRAVEAAPLPATGNPTTFERGTKARAVRDVLARKIEASGSAKEPYAVATAKVKEEGPAKAAEGLPPAEVKAELKEQTEAAKG